MSGLILLGLRILAALVLYAFLGWALYLIWRSIKGQAELQMAHKVMPIELVETTQMGKPKIHHFTQPEALIGRDIGCACQLNDNAVSAYHARLSFHHNHWWLEDLNSRNGTLLNKEKLRTATILVDGDNIQCGNSHIQVHLQDNLPGAPEPGL
jgi:pSer/pThr/pTyr-binding forkhead associated (FHA) protein